MQGEEHDVALAVDDDFARVDRAGEHAENGFFCSFCLADLLGLLVGLLVPVPDAEHVVGVVVNGIQALAAVGLREGKGHNLPLEAVLDNAHCFKCMVVPQSNMRRLTIRVFTL